MYEIMVVDDDSTSLAIARALLESEYHVVQMKSGLQALGYLKRNEKPDLILLDMVMPGISGMEFLRELNQQEDLREIPVLFLSATDDVEAEVEGFTLGAVDFLQKPANPDLLKLKIRRQLYFLSLKRENRLLRGRLEEIKGLCVPPETVE